MSQNSLSCSQPGSLRTSQTGILGVLQKLLNEWNRNGITDYSRILTEVWHFNNKVPANTLKRCSIPLPANLKHASWVIRYDSYAFSGFLHCLSSLLLTQMTCSVTTNCLFFLRQCTAFITICWVTFRWTIYFLLF